MNPAPKAVIFDWAGTLEDTYDDIRADAMNLLGSEEEQRAFYTSYKKHKRAAKLRSNEHLEEWNKGDVVRAALDERNIENPARDKLFETFTCKYLYSGVRELIVELVSRGIVIGLVRNSDLSKADFNRTSLVATHVDDFFKIDENVILSCNSGGKKKPDPAPFMALVEKIPKLKEIHDSNPRHIVFVGNEVECDIKGGNGVRWQTILVRTTEKTSGGLATHEVNNHTELSELLLSSIAKA